MIFKKITDLTEKELKTTSTLADAFKYNDNNFIVEVIVYHEPQKPINGYVMQSTFAIYKIIDLVMSCVHYEFFSEEFTNEQMQEAIESAKKHISKYSKENVKIVS